MGCFIEANKDYNIEGLDIVIGNKDKNKIVELLDEYFSKRETIKRLYSKIPQEFEDMYIEDFPGRTRAFVKIQDGCENFCSYCIIPFVRGKCRSKDFNKVLEEVKALVKNGYKEIVLTGIHTGNYGVDLNTNFASLLKELVKIEGLKRLRISSIEITELTDEVLDIIKESNVIVDHLHIPLQSGSDTILKLMNRKYDLDYFYKKIEKIRSIRKDIAITTDIIVGFPMEDDELFNETLKTAKELAFAKIHVFPYSERKGTKSATFDNKVEPSIKKMRARELLKLSKELEIAYAQKFIGKKLEVLTEEVKDGNTYGHTSNYLHVKINRELPRNSFVTVEIKELDYPYLIAE